MTKKAIFQTIPLSSSCSSSSSWGEDDPVCLLSPSTEPALKKARKKQVVPRICISQDSGTRVNDEIHKSIDIDPVLNVFMQTNVFQRLRQLKQLGTSHFTYPGANHSRFEHSLGVAHLAAKLARKIIQKQPQLKCTAKDILCVKLAGAFHDIGHAAFSHVFENFCSTAFPQFFAQLPDEIKEMYHAFPDIDNDLKEHGHEEVSLRLIDFMLEEALGVRMDLSPEFRDQPLREIEGVDGGIDPKSLCAFDGMGGGEILTSRDFAFIKELIVGSPLKCIQKETGEQGFFGRPDWQRHWLYQIVHNRVNGLDVDKMDYLARDQKRTFAGSAEIQQEKLIEDARVCLVDCGHSGTRHLEICYPEKLVDQVTAFFNNRFHMFSTVYNHKNTVSASLMVCDILCAADPFFRLSAAPCGAAEGSDFPELPISRAMLDLNAFCRLKDSVIDLIEYSKGSELEDARQLAQQYSSRKLYKCAAEFIIDQRNTTQMGIFKLSEKSILDSFMSFLDGDLEGHKVEEADVAVHKNQIHRGAKDKHPIAFVSFFPPRLENALHNEASHLPVAEKIDMAKYRAHLPQENQQCFLRIFSRNQEKVPLIKSIASEWWNWKNKITASSILQSTIAMEITPLRNAAGLEEFHEG